MFFQDLKKGNNFTPISSLLSVFTIIFQIQGLFLHRIMTCFASVPVYFTLHKNTRLFFLKQNSNNFSHLLKTNKTETASTFHCLQFKLVRLHFKALSDLASTCFSRFISHYSSLMPQLQSVWTPGCFLNTPRMVLLFKLSLFCYILPFLDFLTSTFL